MKKLLLAVTLLLFGATAYTQTTDSVLSLIEANNTELKALASELEAAKAENMAAVALPDPEIEAAYLFGAPNSIGNRRDFSVSQSFDFATLTGANRSVAIGQNNLLGIEYKVRRAAILTEARNLCIEVIYYNALLNEAGHRLSHAQSVADATAEMVAAGSASALDGNKARLNLSSAKSEVVKIELERQNLLSRLAAMNGGMAIVISTSEYEPFEGLTESFEEWYAEAEQRNPVLAYARGRVELGRQELRRSRTAALPTLTAGYISEVVAGESFRGICAGVSIPLWSSRRRIDSAKQAVSAAESRAEDARTRFYAEVRAQFDRTVALGQSAAQFRQTLDEVNNAELLQEALDEGELSLLDYVVEIGIYYQTIDDCLSAERDYRLALSQLESYAME
ncbi:MAG: TolC family protein [Tidjanibacter sp.]|nr:TolC family protein [Tidjanibacter sp.]